MPRHFKKQTVILVIVSIGLVLALALVSKRQFLGTKADVDVTKTFDIKDANGQVIPCNNNVCETPTLDVTIRLKDTN